MSIWRWLPWKKARKSNYKNSPNYEDGSITQSITTINSNSHNSNDNNQIRIITDDPAEEDALYFQGYSENLANIIKGTNPKFAVGIFGKWGTGKTTLMRMIKLELDKDTDKILTVWFDAWRYEKEKYLAVIPFLRQIRIALENEFAKNRKTSRWNLLREGLEKTFTAFIESTEVSVDVPGSPVSATINSEKFRNSWKSMGSTHIDGEHVQFHEHITDYLKNALKKLEQENPGSRIVVFVDDLDRCTPEKALDVLESIKAFFDIEGIVYVIGMDSDSIDHIIKQKYGEHSKIKGIDYLEKIVQLPFQIPVWKNKDISESIEKIIEKGLKGSEVAIEFRDPAKKSLIVNAIEPNPRQVKRFVNNIILAKAVFGKDVDIDKLIAVQALNFNRNWNRFLESITSDKTRENFFKDYYIPMKEQGKIINSKDALDSFIKEKSETNSPLPREIIDIFQELIKPENVTLTSFLDAGADKILLAIKTMEDYRRALEATKLKQEEELTGKQVPTRGFLLELLRTGRVNEFNDVRGDIYPDLSKADLSYANLSGAKLTGADLSSADLSSADLSSADLSGAKLTGADLSDATLWGADLSSADLSSADLSSANLSYAYLSYANLSGAKLTGADLSSSKLDNSIILLASYEYNGLKCVDADLKDAIIDDEKLSIQLSRSHATNVPQAVKNKRELTKKLSEKGRILTRQLIDELVSHSSLQD